MGEHDATREQNQHYCASQGHSSVDAFLHTCRGDGLSAGGSTPSKAQRNESTLQSPTREEAVCPNCCLAHPTNEESKGHFCTEGTQGLLESAVAMATLGLVRW